MEAAFEYAESVGLELLKDYKYDAKDENCHVDPSKKSVKV